MERFSPVVLGAPDWMAAALPPPETEFPSVEERMRLVIQLARENVRRGTGGPFGAAVFDLATGRLMAPGVNRVLALNCSILHAEMMAIALAQRRIGDFDLGHAGPAGAELVASTEPCAMCFGAVPWSGVRRLVCGARDEDARAIGFDEGPKLAEWAEALEVRGITVVRDVLRDEAAAVLREYAEGGGVIYNPGGEGDGYMPVLPPRRR
jgi:tRNA(Arg) A34 adenosine deaminase TadA